MKFVIKEDPISSALDIPLFFALIWVVMLSLGALGHRLHVPFLLHIGYWDVALARIASNILRSQPIRRWVVAGEK